MVCYALLCVFSRFALILMLGSDASMWERRLDLKVYVLLLTIPWRCFFCGSFLLLIRRMAENGFAPPPREFCRHILSCRELKAESFKRCLHSVLRGVSL